MRLGAYAMLPRVFAAIVATAFAAPVVATFAVPVGATVTPARIPLPQGQIRTGSAPSAGQGWHPARVGQHLLFGTIVALRGSFITVRLRNGRVQIVDATAAIANGDYSAPLFVGKIVSVDGVSRGTTFIAAHIVRMENLTDLQADH
jgi:hypothetical protein